MRDAIAAAFDFSECEFGSVPFERNLVRARDEREIENMEQVHDPADYADWTQMCTSIC
jgi:hypothetical protein